MALIVFLSHLDKQMCAELPADGTIGDLFKEAGMQMEVAPKRLRIRYQDQRFTDMDMPLADAGLSNEAVVHIELAGESDWKGAVTSNSVALSSEELQARLEFILSSNGWFRMQDHHHFGQEKARMVWSGGFPKMDDIQCYDDETVRVFNAPEELKPLGDLTGEPGGVTTHGGWKCHSAPWGAVWQSDQTTACCAVTMQDAAYLLGSKKGALTPSGTVVRAKQDACRMKDEDVKALLEMMQADVPQVVSLLTGGKTPSALREVHADPFAGVSSGGSEAEAVPAAAAEPQPAPAKKKGGCVLM